MSGKERLLSSEIETSKQVVAAVIFDKNRESVLVGQRASKLRFGGKWEFIGGKVEPGEEISKAMVREIDEELHLAVKPITVLDFLEHDMGGDIGVVKVNYVECEFLDGASLDGNLEFHDDIKWVRFNELESLDFIGKDLIFAQKLTSGSYQK